MSSLAHAPETPGAARWRHERDREHARIYDWRWNLHRQADLIAIEEADEAARADIARLRARIARGEVWLPHERWADHRVLRLLAREDWSYVVIAIPKFSAELRGTFARVRIDGLPEEVAR